jgi:hypothetical protein
MLKVGFAKLIERCSDGVEDQGAEDPFWAPREKQHIWKASRVRATLLSAHVSSSYDVK